MVISSNRDLPTCTNIACCILFTKLPPCREDRLNECGIPQVSILGPLLLNGKYIVKVHCFSCTYHGQMIPTQKYFFPSILPFIEPSTNYSFQPSILSSTQQFVAVISSKCNKLTLCLGQKPDYIKAASISRLVTIMSTTN